MRLYTPKGLLYPIKVTRLLRKPGDELEENAPLFDYEYNSKVTEGVWDFQQAGYVDKEVERTWPATFEAELEGTLTSLSVTVGQIITGRTLVADVEEACKHEVQFGGLCANCGKDMKEVKSYNSTVKGTDRATINTIHDRHGMHTVLISQDETVRADEEAKRRLLDQRKLTLVVDLDQTVIQCCVEETVGEWKNDPSNPNYDALKDVASFRLPHDSKTYYLKFRPGLKAFLEEMSKLYEMHVYTMASRDYAQIVTNLIDPERTIFGTRVLSRDENGPEMRKALKRLFPVDTSMVVIIDDRGDVWQWSPNLIKVNAYDFFVGVGDINSSFLPKRQELEAKPKQPVQVEKVEKEANGEEADANTDDGEKHKSASKVSRRPSGPPTPPMTPPAANGEVSAVDLMVSMAGNQDDDSLEDQKHEHDETLASQVADRPLLQKQKILDAADEEAKDHKDSPAVEEASEILQDEGAKKEATPADHPKYRHNLLQDDDTELDYLGRNLKSVHDTFFADYEKGLSAGEIGRVAELRAGKPKKLDVQDLQNLPDAAVIMQAIKARVLGGVHLVFSGVVPLGVNVHTHDTVIWAKTFGATVTENITKKTTHVIASPERRTAKVRQAAKKSSRIAIVSSGWLFACFSQWLKVDEGPFRIHSDAPQNGAVGLPDSFEDKEAGTLSSSDEEAALTETENENEPDAEAANGAKQVPEADTDVEEELERYAPHDGRDDSSPTEGQQSEDWDALQAELQEFMGSDAEDSEAPDESDNDSDRDGTSTVESTPSGHKRKRNADSDPPTSDPEGSRLQKRKREALGRTTSLTNMATAGSTDGAVTVDDVAGAGELDGIAEDEGDDNEDEDLEAALAAELEKDDDDGGEAEGET